MNVIENTDNNSLLWRDQIVAFIILFTYLIIFSLTLTNVHNYADDAVSWAVIINNGCPMVHQHHILYFPLAKVIKSIITIITNISTLKLLQFISAVFGAIGLTVFYLILRLEKIMQKFAVLWTIILSLTWGYWAYSVEGDVYIPATALLLSAVFIALLIHRCERKREFIWILVLILLFCCSVFIHQMAAFSYPGIAFIILTKDRASFKRRALLLSVFTICSLVIGMGVYYLFYLYHINKIASLYPPAMYGNFWTYCMGYAGGRVTSLGFDILSTIVKAIAIALAKGTVGIGRTFVSITPWLMHPSVYAKVTHMFPDKLLYDDYYVLREYPRWFFYLSLTVLGMLGSIVVGCFTSIILHIRRIKFKKVRTWLIFIILPFIFSLFWEPDSEEFWIIILPFFVIIMATFIEGISTINGVRSIQINLTVLAIICLFLLNGIGAVIPNMNSNNDYFWHTKDYLDSMAPQDAALTFDHFISWNISLYRAGNERILSSWFFRWDCEPVLTIERLEEKVDNVVSKGGHLWLDPQFINPDPVNLCVSSRPEMGNVQKIRKELLEYVISKYSRMLIIPDSTCFGFQP